MGAVDGRVGLCVVCGPSPHASLFLLSTDDWLVASILSKTAHFTVILAFSKSCMNLK